MLAVSIPALTLIGVAAVVVKVYIVPSSATDCRAASRSMSPGAAVVVCRQEYDRTKSPITGAYLADVLRRSSRVNEAGALANDLLSTEVRGDAYQILGKIAWSENRIDDAVAALQQARRLHREHGNHQELARDDQALAEIQSRADQYAEALQSLDECIAEAKIPRDKLTEGYCHLSAARALIGAGYFDVAHQELDRAAPLLSADRDLAQLWHWRGTLELEMVRGPLHVAHNQQAVAALEHAFEYATRAQFTSLVLNLHMRLTYGLAELGRVDEADRHLQEAGSLDSNRDYVSQRAQLEARIEYRRGNLALAFSLNERLYPHIDEDEKDEQIDVCVMQATIALRTRDLDAAIRWGQRGVEIAEKIRSAQKLSELRPWVLASRREPFEVLFTAFARAQRIKNAFAVFDRWQGRTLVDQMARPSSEPSQSLANTAARVQRLGQWLPVVSSAPLMANDGAAATATLDKIDVIALAVAQNEHEMGEVWQLTATHGQFHLESLGLFDQLRDRLDRFMSAPTDALLAGELGARLVPDDMARKTSEPLYVVLDATLAALPFVALRKHEQPLIALRPVVRTPRLPVANLCAAPLDADGALVLADAAGDLPDARRESRKVATLFRTTPLLGAAATSTALFAAKSGPLLHIAVHADVDAGGGVLKLHDRAVSAPEISAHRLGPSLVVLSACSTARSWDPELAGSLSTAFLAAGSLRVIATLRPVTDAGALELTSRFYEARGANDPVHVLAEVQSSLAQSGNKEWPNFAVFGREACVPAS
jgi:tetratricopeptide (TPR) repeat protein